MIPVHSPLAFEEKNELLEYFFRKMMRPVGSRADVSASDVGLAIPQRSTKKMSIVRFRGGQAGEKERLYQCRRVICYKIVKEVIR